MDKKLKPRWYQQDACDEIFKSLSCSKSHPICVMPTGSGKSLVIAMTVDRFLKENPSKTILILSHVSEILRQDRDALIGLPDSKIGIYSAQLNSRTIKQVTIAGIQSVYRKPELFKNVGLIVVDECHLISDDSDTMYRKLFTYFDTNVLGLTATPFRSRGYLHQIHNALFTEICYDLSSTDNFQKLIKEGYLCQLFSKSTNLKMDTKGVKTTAGDFNNKELSKKFNTEQITEVALDEVMETGKNFKKWLIFAIDIEHAENIQEYLNENNINCGIVHSKMENDRDHILDRYRDGFYRAVVNVNVLTTGIDIPDIDLIILLRPTKSPVVYAQSVGRGLRVAEGKEACVVLDFAGNVSRHGPVDSIVIRNKGKKQKGEPVTKECPECQCINHAAAKICVACNHEFEFKVKIDKTASDLDILQKKEKVWIDVDSITVNRHKKRNKPDSIRIDYYCGLRRYSQWAAINSYSGYAAHSAKYVLSRFVALPEEFDYTIENILDLKGSFRTPKRIFVNKMENFPEVDNIEF